MIEKLVLSPEEACRAIGVSKSTMAKLLATGDLPSFKIGHLRKITVEALRLWVHKQAQRDDDSVQHLVDVETLIR